tara:strand:- start:668 stop:913 length:246 start_codon:yes stop_codon:yes gene_type:complete
MSKIGVSMEFKLVEQTRRLVEVTALLALSLHDHRNAKVIEALEKYAFPEEIQLEEIGYCGCAFCITNKREGKKYDMHVVEK